VLVSQQGQLELGVRLLRQAIAIAGWCALYHNNLGNVFAQQGHLEAALGAYRTAIRLQPDCAEAHYNLGTVLQRRGDFPAAAAAYQTALQFKPTYVGAHNNLGLLFQEQGYPEAAQAHFETAIRLRPDLAAAHNNLGLALQDQGQYTAATGAYRTALQLQPAYPEAYNNLGTTLYEQGQYTAAMAAYDEALLLRPAYAEARWNQALVWLTLGDLQRGWPAYAWRLQTAQHVTRSLPVPAWDGTSLQGRTICVWAEQGVGDEVLFASCLPDLLQKAEHVVLQCDPRLAPLLARSFPTASIVGQPRGTPLPLASLPRLDVHCPIGSLPRYLRPSLAGFPRQAGYMRVDTQLQRRWHCRLSALGPGLKVGLSWRSRRNRRQAAAAYTALEQWGAVLAVPGLHWVNLQYDGAAEELAAVRQRWGVRVQVWEDLDVEQDLEGVAALMTVLDLVLAPDTAVAQLAGAVGVPVWRLTIHGGDETRLGTGVMPWWPTVRIYQQPRPGEWASVLADIASDLTGLRQQLATENSLE
jgi:Tfp pilus assembly protein PilF